MKTKCFIFLFFIILVAVSCATKKQIEYVDREIVKYETKLQRDTFINDVHDSVYCYVYQKGDTFYSIKYKERIKTEFKNVFITDTFYHDSIQVRNKYIEKTKEVVPSWCYKMLVICLILCIFAVIIIISHLKKRYGNT